MNNGARTNLKVPEIVFVVLLHFFGFTSRFGDRFRDVSIVWSVSCLLFFYSRCPRAQPFVKVGEVAAIPYGVGAIGLELTPNLSSVVTCSVIFCQSVNFILA